MNRCTECGEAIWHSVQTGLWQTTHGNTQGCLPRADGGWTQHVPGLSHRTLVPDLSDTEALERWLTT